jgi:putative NIF3 family GTP cyclohydrolase 1 type 2
MISVIFEDYKQGQIVNAMKTAHPYEEVAHQIYSLENTNHYSGLGMYGDLDEPMDEKDFLKFVKEKFSLEMIRHSGFNNKKIKRVGVLAVPEQAESVCNFKKCDAYLTGDVKYHDFFLADSK